MNAFWILRLDKVAYACLNGNGLLSTRGASALIWEWRHVIPITHVLQLRIYGLCGFCYSDELAGHLIASRLKPQTLFCFRKKTWKVRKR